MEKIDPILREAAIRDFGDESRAMRWLTTPCQALDGKRPIDADVEEALNLLRRLEHGFGA